MRPAGMRFIGHLRQPRRVPSVWFEPLAAPRSLINQRRGGRGVPVAGLAGEVDDVAHASTRANARSLAAAALS